MPSPQAKYFERIDESRRKKGKTGPEWHLEQTDQTPVIMTKYSERIKPSSLSRWWSLERGNYGLDDFSLHELRHTYLTLLAERGVYPKVRATTARRSRWTCTPTSTWAQSARLSRPCPGSYDCVAS
ncbi:hypothetical protein [Parafannyhessea umbonata]|uniref:hypothetical protein n=1 Tax=Parafannyhessea umbonata TaxID=604330 RepID=UPI0012FDF9FC|nr:hypothetical protein [Parafannyhessea umbonata]